MKEPDYMMKIMGTGGALVTNGCKEARRKWKDGRKNHATKFAYTKPFHWHFHYRRINDDHNKLLHALTSIEDIWKTYCWPDRVFAFLLAELEVNFFW